MIKILREIIGYLLGALLFVGLMPALMWLASGRPELLPMAPWRIIVALVLMVGGLALSVWTIVYMKRQGRGNPMDAFGHEVAPRTSHLMTDGPYRLNRNPMLSGTLLYLAGVAVALWCWQACAVLGAFYLVMWLQVLSEERRLRRDFGQEYDDYCRRRRRF